MNIEWLCSKCVEISKSKIEKDTISDSEGFYVKCEHCNKTRNIVVKVKDITD